MYCIFPSHPCVLTFGPPLAIPSVMLDIQYRMHPDISRFPSAEFYNFSLSDGTVDSDGKVVPFLDPPISSHLTVNPTTGSRPSLIFLDHAGSESTKDRSRVNWNEAHIVCSIVEDLLLHNRVRTLSVRRPACVLISYFRTFVDRISG